MATDFLPTTQDAPGSAIQALKHLSPDELQEAQRTAQALDMRDSAALRALGVKPMNEMRALSAPLLNAATGKDAGEAGDILADLLTQVRSLDATSLAAQAESGAARLPLIGRWFSRARRLLARYEKINVKIERIRVALDNTRNSLNRDIAVLDQLYDRNSAAMRALLVAIAAGELKLAELHSARARAATEAAAASDPVLAHQAADMGNALMRLERKVFDLKLSAMVALQTAPQIRLIQNGNQALVDKIQTSVMLTVPLWQNQVSMAITVLAQERSRAMLQRVTDTTGDLITSNADRQRHANAATQREAERGIIELEKLQHANDQLIASIEDSLRIHAEGRQKRHEAEVALEKMSADLQAKLAEASGPKAAA